MTTTTTTTTRSLRVEGVATALSSISHGGDRAGTIMGFRREKVAGPGGVVEVPVVSGNAVRGVLRDYAADVTWRALGCPELPAPVFHLLWSGGSLAKAGAGHTLSSAQLSEVRRLVPLVSLFGGSGAGRIIEGKLRVGKMTPVCAETVHLLPAGVGTEGLPSMWDLLQLEEFTRRDDSKRDLLYPAIEGMAARELPVGDGQLLTVVPGGEVETADDGPAQQMRYGVETLAAGTRLHWWMSLTRVTDVEVALLAAAVEAWAQGGAAVGGRAATGHGRLRLDVGQWAHQAPAVTVGEALDVAGRDPLGEHVEAHRDEILTVLGWFT